MAKTTAALIIFLSALTLLLGYNYFARPFADWRQELIEPEEEVVAIQGEPVLTPADLAGQLVETMSPQERVSSLLAVPVELDEDSDLEEILDELEADFGQLPAVVTIFGSAVSANQVLSFNEMLEQRRGEKSWLVVDHEGGSVQRLSGEGFTVLPSWQEQCQLENQGLLELWTRIGAELAASGIDVVLAPVVDFAENHPVLRERICGSNPDEVVQKALVMAGGLEGEGVLPVFKHFPGIGQTSFDLHRRGEDIVVGLAEAAVYRTILEELAWPAVMTSHVGVRNQFPGLPCSLSKDCVGELAAVNAQVLIVSDALEMEAALGSGAERLTLASASAKALMAGNHLLIYGPDVSFEDLAEVRAELVELYDSDAVFRDRVDAAVRRVVEYRLLQK